MTFRKIGNASVEDCSDCPTRFLIKNKSNFPLLEFGKKRKSKTEGKQLVRQESCVSEAYCFREDNWKEISEDLYFESVGYQRASQREGFRLNRNLIDQG